MRNVIVKKALMHKCEMRSVLFTLSYKIRGITYTFLGYCCLILIIIDYLSSPKNDNTPQITLLECM